MCLSFPPDIPLQRHSLALSGREVWGGGDVPGVQPRASSLDFSTPTAGPASPLRLQVWSGNKRELLQGSAEDSSAAEQRCRATPWALLPVGTAARVPHPRCALPRRLRRQSLSSPPLLPAPVSSALPRFQAPLHSKVVTNFQLRPGEPNRAENAPSLQRARELGPAAFLSVEPTSCSVPVRHRSRAGEPRAPMLSWHPAGPQRWASLGAGGQSTLGVVILLLPAPNRWTNPRVPSPMHPCAQ